MSFGAATLLPRRTSPSPHAERVLFRLFLQTLVARVAIRLHSEFAACRVSSSAHAKDGECDDCADTGRKEDD